MPNKKDYIVSGGNVFEDLGLADAEERLAKAKLASKIIDITKIKKGWTQKETALFLGIDQPKVSDLQRGNLSGFSISRLIKFLNILEQDVEILIKEKSNKKENYGHLNVLVDSLKNIRI